MAERTLSPLFTWRSVICDSTLAAPTRHVALVLSLHMSERGDSCFPRIDTLADETGLAERTVADHLKKLEEGGYLTREFDRRGKGRGTKVEYRATFPTTSPGTTCGETTCAPTTRGPAHDHPSSDDTTTRRPTGGQEDAMRASGGRTPPRPQPAAPAGGGSSAQVEGLVVALLAACRLERSKMTRSEWAKARNAAAQLAEIDPVPTAADVQARAKTWRARWPSQPNPTGLAANWGSLAPVASGPAVRLIRAGDLDEPVEGPTVGAEAFRELRKSMRGGA